MKLTKEDITEGKKLLEGMGIKPYALIAHPEDIPELIAHFSALASLNGTLADLPPSAVKLLGQQPWPGNVRQLFNVLRRVASTAEAGKIGRKDFAEALAY